MSEAIAATAHTPYPVVPLSEILSKSEEWIQLDPERIYKQVTVRMWGQGVVQRCEVAGVEVVASRMLVVHANQFIISRIDARNGASGLIPDCLDGAIVTNDFPVFIPNAEKILPAFLSWMSKTHGFVDLCKAASEGTTNRVRLKEDRFLSMAIPLPPISEQRRIVARIEELAGKVEEARGLRSTALEEIEALKKSAMRQIFNSDAIYLVVTLESVCVAIIDNLHSNPIYLDDGTQNGIPCVRSSDVGWGSLLLDTARRTSEDEFKHRTVRGEAITDDIVLVREGGGTGKAAIVAVGQRFSLGQRVMMLRPDQQQVVPKFFLHQILSPYIQDEQILPQCMGSASPHLNIGALKKFGFLLPPLPEQRRIVAYLDDLQAKVDALKRLQSETAAELNALLPSILDKAFKGEL